MYVTVNIHQICLKSMFYFMLIIYQLKKRKKPNLPIWQKEPYSELPDLPGLYTLLPSPSFLNLLYAPNLPEKGLVNISRFWEYIRSLGKTDIIIPFYNRKQKLREVKQLSQCHPAGKWQNQYSMSDYLSLKLMSFSIPLWHHSIG